MKFNYFHDNFPKQGRKFIAFYGDGSGCDMFKHLRHHTVFKQASSDWKEELHITPDWFEESGYLQWAYLPDNFQFWGE